MEKISQIVRPNARMAAVDVNQAGAARPGSPGFGRPVADSRSGGPVKEFSTADRATMAANDLAEQRRPSETKIIDQLARDFFGDKGFTSGPAADQANPGPTPAAIRNAVTELSPPSGYVPRGTFVDVRA